MKFHGFQKILEASSGYKFTPKEQAQIFRQAKWVATEKIHGANFSIYFCPSTGETRFAKRTGFLKDEEDYFYGYAAIKDDLEKKAADVVKFLRSAAASSSSVSSAPTSSTCTSASSGGACSVPLIGSLAPSAIDSLSYIILYGELCGGFYPPPLAAAPSSSAAAAKTHSSPSASASASSSSLSVWQGAVTAGRINAKMQCTLPLEERAVQEGIYYSPNLCFALFDIAVVHHTREAPEEEEEEDGKGGTLKKKTSEKEGEDDEGEMNEIVSFLDFDVVLAAASAANIPTPKPLVRGTYAKVCEFPYKAFDSVFAVQSLGLHPLPPGTNMAEGIVIKPECVLPITGASLRVSPSGEKSPTESRSETSAAVVVRCLVKLKSPTFAEISLADYVEPSPTAVMRLRSLANGNRLASVLSKHGGRVTDDTIDDVSEFMVDDVVEDFYVRFSECASNSFGQEWDAAVDSLRAHCKKLLSGSLVK